MFDCVLASWILSEYTRPNRVGKVQSKDGEKTAAPESHNPVGDAFPSSRRYIPPHLRKTAQPATPFALNTAPLTPASSTVGSPAEASNSCSHVAITPTIGACPSQVLERKVYVGNIPIDTIGQNLGLALFATLKVNVSKPILDDSKTFHIYADFITALDARFAIERLQRFSHALICRNALNSDDYEKADRPNAFQQHGISAAAEEFLRNQGWVLNALKAEALKHGLDVQIVVSSGSSAQAFLYDGLEDAPQHRAGGSPTAIESAKNVNEFVNEIVATTNEHNPDPAMPLNASQETKDTEETALQLTSVDTADPISYMADNVEIQEGSPPSEISTSPSLAEITENLVVSILNDTGEEQSTASTSSPIQVGTIEKNLPLSSQTAEVELSPCETGACQNNTPLTCTISGSPIVQRPHIQRQLSSVDLTEALLKVTAETGDIVYHTSITANSSPIPVVDAQTFGSPTTDFTDALLASIPDETDSIREDLSQLSNDLPTGLFICGCSSQAQVMDSVIPTKYHENIANIEEKLGTHYFVVCFDGPQIAKEIFDNLPQDLVETDLDKRNKGAPFVKLLQEDLQYFAAMPAAVKNVTKDKANTTRIVDKEGDVKTGVTVGGTSVMPAGTPLKEKVTSKRLGRQANTAPAGNGKNASTLNGIASISELDLGPPILDYNRMAPFRVTPTEEEILNFLDELSDLSAPKDDKIEDVNLESPVTTHETHHLEVPEDYRALLDCPSEAIADLLFSKWDQEELEEEAKKAPERHPGKRPGCLCNYFPNRRCRKGCDSHIPTRGYGKISPLRHSCLEILKTIELLSNREWYRGFDYIKRPSTATIHCYGGRWIRVLEPSGQFPRRVLRLSPCIQTSRKGEGEGNGEDEDEDEDEDEGEADLYPPEPSSQPHAYIRTEGG
ncbi:hypothetical protein K440DRAFT_670700 [Wilcoxina mikolae CBS 423.85]|nr:hypothetical protein K440DRAFT_670700 [Wilcoxina mikolae CBS 423.85]